MRSMLDGAKRRLVAYKGTHMYPGICRVKIIFTGHILGPWDLEIIFDAIVHGDMGFQRGGPSAVLRVGTTFC